MEPDRLLTDRAAYVTYLEMQLERVTSALLTAQAVQAATQPGPARPGGSAEGQVEPVRQQVGCQLSPCCTLQRANRKSGGPEEPCCPRPKANRALDLAEEVRRCQEKLDDFSKQAFINLARRIEALEIRGVTSEEEEEKRREAEGKAAEEQQDREKRMVQMVLEVKEEMLRAVAKEVAAAMSAWTREHQSAVSELKSRLSDLRGPSP